MREKGKKKVTFKDSDKELEVKGERKKFESLKKEMREGIEKGLRKPLLKNLGWRKEWGEAVW